MPYINTIDINGVVYTLENLTDGNNIVTLPELSRDDIFVLRGNIVDNTSSTSAIQPLSARQGKLLRDDLNAEIQNRINDVNLEEERATEAERVLTENLNAEIERAEGAEHANALAITLEKNRAKQAEADELDRAQAAEKVLTDNLSAEVTRATNKENEINTALTNEISRATGVESGLASRIATMETFFKEADIDASKDFIDTLKEIQSYIESDKTGASAMTASINANKTAIEAEVSRAKSAEGSLQDGLDAIKDAVCITKQSWSEEQKAQARENIGACEISDNQVSMDKTWSSAQINAELADVYAEIRDSVSYRSSQDKTDEEKAQARKNIGAEKASVIVEVTYDEITNTVHVNKDYTEIAELVDNDTQLRTHLFFMAAEGDETLVMNGMWMKQDFYGDAFVFHFDSYGDFVLQSDNTAFMVLSSDYVRYDVTQGLTSAQQAQARENISAISKDYVDEVAETINDRIGAIVGTFVEPVDCIVEQGTSGNWTYRKWNSGISECWGTLYGTLAPTEKESGISGLRVFSGSVAFPTNVFVDPPDVTYNCRIGDGYSFPSDAATSTATHFNWTALSTVGIGYSECAIAVKASGVWK